MSATATFLDKTRPAGLALGLALGLGVLTAGTAPPASAQDVADQLRRRIVKLERDIQALQREMRASRGNLSTGTGSGGGKIPPTVAARFEIRMTQLERSIEKLTGRVEDLGFQIKSVQKAQKKFQNDVEFRLSELEKGGGRRGAAPRARRNAAPGGNTGNNGGTRVASRTPAAPTVTLPPGTAVQQYRFARGFLIQREYAKAQSALDAFVKRHPNNRLTSNAYYWLGESYYVQGNYRQAAVAFADGFKKFKAHPKAPDNLYKLGMSLSKMRMRPQACAAFKELRLRYPTAAPDLRRRADGQRRALGCRG